MENFEQQINMLELSAKELSKFKELLVKRSDKNHIYYFEFEKEAPRKTIKAFYVVDEDDKKWISVSAMSEIFPEKKYDHFKSKFIDITADNQQQFFIINPAENIGWASIDKEYKSMVKIIRENTKKGTPRKFLESIDKQKINIEYTPSSPINLSIEL